MTQLYAQSNAAFSAQVWNTQADGFGDPGTPASGDTLDCNGYVVDLDVLDISGMTLVGGDSGTNRWGLPATAGPYTGACTVNGYVEGGGWTWEFAGAWSFQSSSNLNNTGSGRVKISASVEINGSCSMAIEMRPGGTLSLNGLMFYGPSGVIDSANVVDPQYVQVGHDNYVGGSAGTLDTTALEEAAAAAQLTDDVEAVEAKADVILSGETILGVSGEYVIATPSEGGIQQPIYPDV